jgi:microcystin-dependent protein
MADVTINELTPGVPSNAAIIPYSEGGITKGTTVSNFGVPIGAVFHLATSTVPTGYLKCNGNVLPNGTGTVQGVTANFSALYAVLGSTYGVAGTLPDLRGEFVRGFDDGRGIDTGRVMGSSQGDNIKAIPTVSLSVSFGGSNGYTSSRGYWAPTATSCYPVGAGSVQSADSSGSPTGRAGGFWNINLTGTSGTETRSRNVALMPVIKY